MTMEGCEEFFSAEALQLLQGYNSSLTGYSLFYADAIPNLPTASPPEENFHVPSAQQTPQECVSPCAEGNSQQKPKRARFNVERKKAVALVRSQGACFRCRVMKRPVRGR